MSLKVKVFPVNAFREVTYVVSDSTGEAIIIDPGAISEGEFSRIFSYIADNNITPKMVVNTHGHLDHIFGVERTKAEYSIPFAISALEKPLLEIAPKSAAMFGVDPSLVVVPQVDIDLSELEEITFGETTIKVIKCPGHSVGGVSLYEPKEKILFTGDTLFQGSIGRTDLMGGDYDQLMTTIVKRILPLGGDVTVYPGHGNHTTLAHEAAYNPFISEVMQGEANFVEQ